MIVIVTGTLFVLLVLILSLVTISKGYGYKHTVDPIDAKPQQTFERDKIKDES